MSDKIPIDLAMELTGKSAGVLRQFEKSGFINVDTVNDILDGKFDYLKGEECYAYDTQFRRQIVATYLGPSNDDEYPHSFSMPDGSIENFKRIRKIKPKNEYT